MDMRTAKIVETLYRYGPLSNQELAQVLDLSPASITHMVQPLLFHGVLKERPPEAYPETLQQIQAEYGSRHRRKITFEPNASHGYAIVIQAHTKSLNFDKVDLGLRTEHLPARILDLDPSHIDASHLADAIKWIRQDDSRHLLGIAMLHDTKTDEIFQLNLCSELQMLIGLPVINVPETEAIFSYERITGNFRQQDSCAIIFLCRKPDFSLMIKGEIVSRQNAYDVNQKSACLPLPTLASRYIVPTSDSSLTERAEYFAGICFNLDYMSGANAFLVTDIPATEEHELRYLMCELLEKHAGSSNQAAWKDRLMFSDNYELAARIGAANQVMLARLADMYQKTAS